MSSNGHFNSGKLFGKIAEVKEESSSGGKPYLSIKMNVSGAKSGNATAFCRIWGKLYLELARAFSGKRREAV